jgi:monoamine oxidase
MPENHDVIAIGAGAAGLAATRALHDAGHRVVALEARDRIGGRAFTSYDLAPHPVELGAEFIHGENVRTWELIRAYGFDTVDQFPLMNVRGFVDGRLVDQDEFFRRPNLTLAFRMRAGAEAWVASHPDEDASIADAAPAWPNFYVGEPTPGELRLWNNIIAELHAADLDDMGVAGYLEPTFEGDGVRLQYRIREGYSRVWQRMAEGLDIRLQSPVERLDWGSGGVTAATASETFSARCAIVTLPLALLQQDALRFEPALPAAKREAIARLGAGPIAKIILKFDKPFWPDDLTFLFSEDDSQLIWRPGRGRDDEAPILTSFVGGRAVSRFQALGEGAPHAVLRSLEAMFKLPLADRLVDARFVNWQADPWARMGYAYTPPGGAGQTPIYAAPVDDTLFFAGEATHTIRPHTVHGALETGYRAADEVRSALGG